MLLEIKENTVQEAWKAFDSFKGDSLEHVRLFFQFIMKNNG